MKLIELNLQRIIDLCRQYKVKSLAVFGSILTDRFNDNSDVDLLVDFEPVDHDRFDYVSNYYGFRDALDNQIVVFQIKGASDLQIIFYKKELLINFLSHY